VSVYGGSKLRVAFDITSLVPSKSYINSFVSALESYSEQDAYTCTAFFRDVDFSSQVVQSQMNAYIDELVDLPQITSYPPHFWLQDFQNFTHASKNASLSSSTTNSSFEEQLDMFLDNDYYNVLYSNLIVRDTSTNGGGAMTESAVILSLDNIDLKNVRDQVSFLSSQEEISRHFDKTLQSLGVKTKPDRMPFFTFSEDYFMWEFYAVAVEELLLSTIASVLAVAVITFLFIPRISVLCIVMLSVIMIYMDVLGLMHWAGFSINPVTLIAILMSIGLMVDYVLHVVMRCFEHHKQQPIMTTSQENDVPKVHVDMYDCLSTIGISVMIGGASTVLSTIPLAFSTSEIFFSIFVIFFGFVMFSLMHGLIFVPAILASFNFHNDDTKTASEDEDESAQEVVMEEEDSSSIRKETTAVTMMAALHEN
jgi:Cation/multidrug efflux pump